MSDRLLNLAVLISGGGTTLENLADCCAAGTLDAQIKLVIASRSGIGGIEKATRAGLPVPAVLASTDDGLVVLEQAAGVPLVEAVARQPAADHRARSTAASPAVDVHRAILLERRVDVVEVPAAGPGRRYLIERELTVMAELETIVEDYLNQAARWQVIPAAGPCSLADHIEDLLA